MPTATVAAATEAAAAVAAGQEATQSKETLRGDSTRQGGVGTRRGRSLPVWRDQEPY